MTLDELKAALNEFFSDTSRSKDETREGLEEIIDEADIMLMSMGGLG